MNDLPQQLCVEPQISDLASDLTPTLLATYTDLSESVYLSSLCLATIGIYDGTIAAAHL